MAQDPAPATGTLLQVVMDYPSAQVVHAAARLGLVDLPADGPRSVDNLAAAAGGTPRHSPGACALTCWKHLGAAS